MKCLWLLIAIFLTACGSPAPTGPSEPQELTVYAAASLTEAFSEIGKNFEVAHPGVTVRLNFGGSQTLRTQIEQGAQADLFAPANTQEMDALVNGNFVSPDTAQVFLTNQLVVIMPAQNPAGLARVEDLSRSGLKIILAAPEVPAGSYALRVLDQLDAAIGNHYKANVLANVVSYENDVRLVVAKVQLGEADAGIVYRSDSLAAPGVQTLAIPPAYNVVAQYPIATLAQSQNAGLAQTFMAYLLSAEGQAILKKWGFSPVH